jgi:hypothetical protein
MDKDEALWLGSKLGLDPNGELKSISLINTTHPSLKKSLDETNPRDTNIWKILDNKTSNECHRHRIIETMFSPIDIHLFVSIDVILQNSRQIICVSKLYIPSGMCCPLIRYRHKTMSGAEGLKECQKIKE